MWSPQTIIEPKGASIGWQRSFQYSASLRRRPAPPAMAAGHEAQGAVFLRVVREQVVEVGRVRFGRERGHLELRPIAMHAGARLSRALHPAVAQAQDALAAEQVLDEAERRRVDDDLLEQRIVPEHEPQQLLIVREDAGQFRLRAALALAGHAEQSVADGFVLLRRPHLLRRQNGEAERLQLRHVFQQVELLELAVERRQGLRGRPVFDIHAASISPPLRDAAQDRSAWRGWRGW